MRVADEVSRVSCLQQAENAGPAIRAAIGNIATDTAAVRAQMEARQAKAVEAFDRGKVAMATAAAEELRSMLESDTDLRDLTEAAEEQQALADLPGAPKLAKLLAVVAKRDALHKASEKIVNRSCALTPPYATDLSSIGALGDMVGGLPPRAGSNRPDAAQTARAVSKCADNRQSLRDRPKCRPCRRTTGPVDSHETACRTCCG